MSEGIEHSVTKRARLDPRSAEQIHDRLLASLEALWGLDAGTSLGESSRTSFEPGAVVLRENDPSEAVFFVLKGVAVAVRRTPDGDRELARIGPGQCFGERGVVYGTRRSADIRAETEMEVLEIESARFLAWYEARPELRDFLGALEQVYWLEDGSPLSVYRSAYEGRPCVSTVAGDLASGGIVSTKVLDEDIFVLSRTGHSESASREVEFFASGRSWRALHLGNVVRASSGSVTSASLEGVIVSGPDVDVGAIYRRLLRPSPLSTAELSRFRTTGHLGGDARLPSGSVLCQCLGLSRERLLQAAERHGRRYEAVRKAIGAGVVCGGCVPRVRELLRVSSVEAPGLPTPAPSPPGSGALGALTGTRRRIAARAFEPRYDPRPLAAVRGDHQVHLVALGSLFATCGERFMIGTMLQAAPHLRDPELTSMLEVFIQQESNHIAAHEPLNDLLVGDVYHDCPALRSMRQLAFTRLERASLGLRLAVCAAFEFVADCFFALHFEDRFGARGAHHPDIEVERSLAASGALALFLWHGTEELDHRHVAFEVMEHCGVGYRTRLAGMLLTVWELTRVAATVLPELAWRTTRGVRGAYLRRVLVRPALLIRLPPKLLRFLTPGFHPERVPYPFLEALDSEHGGGNA